MRIDPQICGDVRTRMLRTMLSDPAAEVYVLRLWCWACETGRYRWERGALPPAVLAGAAEWIGDPQVFLQSLRDSGWLLTDGDSGLELAGYAALNAKGIAARANGMAGGRPRKAAAEKPNDNPTGENGPKTETQRKPNDNPTETQAPQNGENGKPNGNPTGENGPKTETQRKPTETAESGVSSPHEDSSPPQLSQDPPNDSPQAPAGKTGPAALHDAAVRAMELPAAIDVPEVRELLMAYLGDRRAKRKYMTAQGLRLLVDKLARYGAPTAAAALRTAIENGWQGVFPESVTVRTEVRADERKDYGV